MATSGRFGQGGNSGGRNSSGRFEERELSPACRAGIGEEDFENDVQISMGAGGIVDQFPQLRELGLQEQMIMVGFALGYSVRHIAMTMKLDRNFVWRALKRIDPDGLIRENSEARKAYIATLARSKGMEAINAITSEKLAECSAPSAAKVAKVMMETAAIAERKRDVTMGDGKIKKVTIEFVDPIDEMKRVAEEGNYNQLEGEMVDDEVDGVDGQNGELCGSVMVNGVEVVDADTLEELEEMLGRDEVGISGSSGGDEDDDVIYLAGGE